MNYVIKFPKKLIESELIEEGQDLHLSVNTTAGPFSAYPITP